MQHPRTPGSSPSPSPSSRPGRAAGVSDGDLAAAVQAGGGAQEVQPVATLLARHWQSVFDYAAICAASNKTASMMTTAAFAQLLENLARNGAVGALRPLLLVTVRHIAKAWTGDQRVAAVVTGLVNPEGPQENRQLVSRAFHAMPMTAQVLLWHAEVEAEGISIPSGLLGIDPLTASGQLDQAREQFRQTCVRVHREYAPTAECRHYNRLLDISLRRGGALIPDIQVHLSECAYCRYTADQLRQTDGRLAVLLAEALLGGAAEQYLGSRPGRRRKARAQGGAAAPAGAGSGAVSLRGGGRHSRGTGPRTLRGLALRGRRMAAVGVAPGALAVGAAVAVTGLLVITLASALWPEDDDHAGRVVPSGAVTGTAPPASGAGTPAPSPSAPAPSATSANVPAGPLTTRLRNVEAGLCLDLADPEPAAGSEVTLAACSSAPGQQWVYETDGRLRSSAAPTLCLNSHELDGIVVLDGCTIRSAPDAVDVRYDLTIQGQVIPRWDDRLALVPVSPGPGTSVVVKIRDESPAQVWQTDTAPRGPQQQSGAHGTEPYAEEVNVPPAGADDCVPETCPERPDAPGAGGRDFPGATRDARPDARPDATPDAVEASPRRADDTPPGPGPGAQHSRPPVVTAVVSRTLVGAPEKPAAQEHRPVPVGPAGPVR
ncbi:ricin-type beta-trefoil lectin domain protein [Streptomyces peucetius]|uniref:Ricin-type beta-trefoil lectin domain protein n=1 Tax=Streptomyces peucetius TaxID=1950 RepID=A0ABY6I4R6_STRPE|nr:ricin-type beta-trefoil lectin domain protein [Streptomyces peucetius]UYQ61970.1 ricin-type beta-trefoil lectin domain protein [Streptomyces peucetius]